MKNFLESLPGLYRVLGPAKSDLLVKCRDHCRPDVPAPILQGILKTIEPDITYTMSSLDIRNQRAFAVKSGFNGMLDVSRQTYKEITAHIHQHVDEINGMTSRDGGMRHLITDSILEQYRIIAKLKFDNSRKYWLQLKKKDLGDLMLPNVFINAIPKRDKIECQTLSLLKLNSRLSDTSNEVVARSDTVLQSLMEDLRSQAPGLFKISDSIALVDMIASFGELATTRDYVKPEMLETLALKPARYSILDKVSSLSKV